MTYSLRLFGLPLIEREGEALTGPVAQRLRLALLALLAVAGERGESRERLIFYLWPDAPARRARQAMSEALYVLRKELGEDSVVSVGDAIRLNPVAIRSDVGEFHAALATNELERAVRAYTGPFLDGFAAKGLLEFERWADDERSRFARLHAEALEKLALQAEERGDVTAAVEWWRQLAEVDPHNSRVALRLIEALAARGDMGAALDCAERHARRLEDELGARPIPELSALVDRLKGGELPAGAAPTRRPASFADAATVGQATKRYPERTTSGSSATTVSTGFRGSVIVAVAVAAGTILATAGSLLFLTRAERVTPPAYHQVTQLGHVREAVLSPDGRSLAYVAGFPFIAETLFFRDLAGGRAVEIASHLRISRPRWSPDGARLLYSGLAGSWDTASVSVNWAGFVVPRLGGQSQRVGAGAQLAWSQDGEIATYRVRDGKLIWQDDPVGEARSLPLDRIPGSITSVSWSPLGTVVLVVGHDADGFSLWSLSLNGEQAYRLFDDSSAIAEPAWHPKGSAVYFYRGNQVSEVWRIRVAPQTGMPRSPPALLLSGLHARGPISLSADGTKLLITQEFDVVGNIIVALGDDLGSGVVTETRNLTSGTSLNLRPSLSPDGRWIAFSAGRGPYGPRVFNSSVRNIYVVSVDGGRLRQLTFMEAFSENPVWSRDGSVVAFGSNQGSIARVWTVPSEGGDPSPVAGTELSSDNYYLSWAPGRRIVYQRPGNRNFGVVDPVSGEEFQLITQDSLGWAFGAKYSPDGLQIAFYWNRQALRGVWRMELADRSSHFVYAKRGFPLVWSADGRWIYTKKYDDERIITRILAEGGAEEAAFTVPVPPFPSPYAGLFPISLAPEADRLAAVHYRTRSDAWLVESFDPEDR